MGKGGGGSTEIKETSQELAAAEIAGKQWALYESDLKPMENLFMTKVDNMNNESKYDDAAGTVNLGYGLIDAARETRQQAMQGLGDASNREIQRESANEQLKSQQKQSQMSMIGVGAGTGMAVGATYGAAGGPIGMGIGAAVGLLASSFF